MVSGDGDYGFDECQKVADATVLAGSSNGKAFDRIGIWFGPYVAGPYAEGAYELNFPVDAKVRAAVKAAARVLAVVLEAAAAVGQVREAAAVFR